MNESKKKISSGHGKKLLNPFAVKKPKKRSLVERELETNMTARMISPVNIGDGVNTSRYGRARRVKYESDNKNTSLETLKSPTSENTPVKVQASASKPVVSTPPNRRKTVTPKKALESSIENIDNIYLENKSLSRFNTAEVITKSPSSAKKFPKMYTRKDLIQNRDDDDDGIVLIKDLFSPNSGKKSKTPQMSSEKILTSSKKQNGHIDNTSVVKALDFDGNKNGNKRDSEGNKKNTDSNKKDADSNKTESDSNKIVTNSNKKKDVKNVKESNKLFDAEATCQYQEGDLAWARMGTFPFWPCLITRDPASEMFVRKKLFGRVEHDIYHVTFFADNGRRSWVVDNMLRKYLGPEEFLSTRAKFTPEDKKKDPRLYAAFFISDKKQGLWNSSVDEAEAIRRQPKNLRIDVFSENLHKARASKKQQKSGKVTRTDSDVSLSESLYDTLFSEDDSKIDDSNRSKNKTKNRSLDVSDVVTACLDNMAAKTGNIKIQKQSHMDRWLQKAKSKTPEKVKTNELTPKRPVAIPKIDQTIAHNNEDATPKVDKNITPNIEVATPKVDKVASNNKKRKLPPKEVKITKIYSLRRSYESQRALSGQLKNEETKLLNAVDCTEKCVEDKSFLKDENNTVRLVSKNKDSSNSNDFIPKDECIADSEKMKADAGCKDDTNINDDDEVLNAINELLEDSCTVTGKDKLQYKVEESTNDTTEVEQLEATLIPGAIKPECMDVDECPEHMAHGEIVTEDQVILNSSSKTENALAENNKVTNEGPVEVDYESPIKIENDVQVNAESRVETAKKSLIETQPVSQNYKNIQEQKSHEATKVTSEIRNVSENSYQTSPTLQRNEMVSIPENSSMTDDDNSMTSLEENNLKTAAIEGYLTNLSEITKIDININSTENERITENCDISIEKPDKLIDKVDKLNNKQDMFIDEIVDEDIKMSEKDLLNQSGDSASILQIALNNQEFINAEESVPMLLNISTNSESILDSCEDKEAYNLVEVKLDEKIVSSNSENTAPSSNHSTNPFLEDRRNPDCVNSTNVQEDMFFREVNINKPPDLISDNLTAKADLLLNVDNNGSDYDEDSDDEPSPEFEPLGEEITEDFRQHMKCIENSITDKKDEAQLVKVCNEIATIEESKLKLADIISSVTKMSPHKPKLSECDQEVKDEEKIKTERGETVKEDSTETIRITEQQVTSKMSTEKCIDTDVSKEVKAEIIDGLEIINKSVENSKKKHNLSLKKIKTSDTVIDVDAKPSVINDNTINPMYKTIDQIEEIMKSKLKRLPIQNGEICIPEVKGNSYKTEVPDNEDADFNIDNASVSSEDSEVSLPQNNVPARRSLRSRPEKRGGLQDPEFLTYLELRQDDLMEEHPELTRDDIVLYLYKTYTYSLNLSSDINVEESPINKSIKQEISTPSRKKTKQLQPKNTIENYFREKYKKPKIDFENSSESASTSSSNDDIKLKRESLSISPVDSGIGNSKDSNESATPVSKRKTKSQTPVVDSTSGTTKEVKVELINDSTMESPKTPKRLRRRVISPRVLDSDLKITSKSVEMAMEKRVPIVVISPIKDEHTGIRNIHRSEKKHKIFSVSLKYRHDAETNIENKNYPEIKIEKVTATTPKQHSETKHVLESQTNNKNITEIKHKNDSETKSGQNCGTKTTNETKNRVSDLKLEHDTETESLDSDNELPLRQLRSKVQQQKLNELKKEFSELKEEFEDASSVSSDNEPLLRLKPNRNKSIEGSYEDPDFLKYLELKQDAIMDENPQLSYNEIKAYLYKTWIYEKNAKSDMQKNDDIEVSNLVKGLNQETAPQRKAKRKPKMEKNIDPDEIIPKDKPRRKTVSRYYNEAFISDIEDELEVFEIFKTKKTPVTVVSKPESPKKDALNTEIKSDELKVEAEEACEEINTLDEVELYFKQLTSPKPSVFKGLIREKVCEICEDISNLIKCRGCNGTFHYDCVNQVVKVTETPVLKGRKKKKKRGRKSKNLDDSENSDDRSHDISEENVIEEVPESLTIDAATIESQLEAKMKEIMEKTQPVYDSYSSDDGIDWAETVPGKCELIDVKLKRKNPLDYANFKCNNCQKHDTPVCFVCKSAVSKTNVKFRQNCNVPHCHSYYHIECLDHWPQTQFNAGELTRSNKTASEQSEALTCPRHVCHTCVSDDPRGCKTRFSGDKLAKCVRCPATYHSFNKCLPAGTQILTASLIICPRHYEHRPGKVPCHVNTGWCFICALGGSLICCEYCPTSFHAECLNIKPPEGNYMCEDCETGRLPLYGEMVWVKLGHYRWWPGVILHPSEIPDNIMAVKHGLGEFVVRFFGQYDHYWVNRGRVFPYQEGDSGRISSQKSKIDEAFTTAMEHAQRALEILKNAVPDEEESLDIASSLLPPHYIKLKCNKPIGSLLGRRIEDPSLSLTQCECDPAEIEPCGPNSQCLNRVLLTECGPTCRAGERCNNRAFEKRQYPKLTPYKAPHRGWGLKTLEDIKAGQFVIEYVGELIDEEEFQRRMRRKHEIRDENFYFLTLDKERMIDAGPKGNLARFMNHCCEPNCETQKWTVLGDIRVGLFAIDDIKANSEVTFNYNLECTGIEKKRCLCGAKRCSGYIGAKPKQLDENRRKRNGETGKRKYIKRKNIEESPATSKSKTKKPQGRPPKPKELTEIEKDLLIIKNATTVTNTSMSPILDDKAKNKLDLNTKPGDAISNGIDAKESSKSEVMLNGIIEHEVPEKLDSNTIGDRIQNGTESKLKNYNSNEDNLSIKSLKRKLGCNTKDEISSLSLEPSAKRQKSDRQIEVAD